MSIIERAVRRLKPMEVVETPPESRLVEIVEHRKTQPTTPTVPSPVAPPLAPRVAKQTERPVEKSKKRAAPPAVAPVEGPFDTIDLADLESSGMIVPGGKRTQISEEFRLIKRKLLHNARQGDSVASRSNNLILVTSAFPNEGKTFSSINLAISMSLELDHSVLLVDADVAQAGQNDFLGLKPRRGLMDLLLDPEQSLEQTIIRTNIERLDVLLAGRSHHQANELLSSESMTRLLNQLASQGPDRIVIFDAPPLLVTTEAGTLAHRAGQVVMVVEAGKTTQAALKSALGHLEGCSVFGLLNKSARGPGDGAHEYSRYRYSE